jgi:hypothetical protein
MTWWSILLGSVAWLASGAGGTSATDGQYLLNAKTDVHAESTVGTYDRSVQAELHAWVRHSGPTEVTLQVRRDTYTCILRGSVAGKGVTLAQGQKCPQTIKGDGFQADLDGTLTSGSAILGARELSVTTNWAVSGTVKLGPLRIPVTGTVQTVAAGAKI